MPKATNTVTKRTRKLSKGQERRLNAALAGDELLYRQFRRMRRT